MGQDVFELRIESLVVLDVISVLHLIQAIRRLFSAVVVAVVAVVAVVEAGRLIVVVDVRSDCYLLKFLVVFLRVFQQER